MDEFSQLFCISFMWENWVDIQFCSSGFYASSIGSNSCCSFLWLMYLLADNDIMLFSDMASESIKSIEIG